MIARAEASSSALLKVLPLFRTLQHQLYEELFRRHKHQGLLLLLRQY
jgi:hypothetical protein